LGISVRTGVGIPDRRVRLGVALAMLAALAGCATIKEHLPRRSPPEKPRTTVVTPAPKPVARPTPPAEPASEFLVIAPGTYDRDRAVVRQALAKSHAGDALAAADVGYYLDILQGRLRQVVGSQGRVTRRGKGLALDLSSSVRFVPGEAPLGPGSAASLAPLAKLLGDYRSLLVAVRVNADTGTSDGARLARQRAVSLARALAGAGIDRRRIVVFGTTPGRQGGARVEVLLEPIVRPVGGP